MDEAKRLFGLQSGARWRISGRGARERLERLERLRQALLRREEELLEAVRTDFGKAPAESAITELYPVLAEIAHAKRELRRWMRPVRVPTPLLLFGTRSEYRFEAKGLVLILSPWNYPVNLLLCPLVAAVAAGNCVVLKPSSKVPATSRMLKSLVEEVFPEEEVALLEGGPEAADALLELPFDHVFFTGSPPVGRKVMAAAARNLAPVTLELGGKSPTIVDASADVALAAERLVWAKFVNAGQTCIAPDYVFVHRSREREFIERCKVLIAERFGSGPEERRASPDLCRLVTEAQLHKLESLLKGALAAGARLEFGGEAEPATRYLEPTIVSGVLGDSPLMAEELFGPILPVLSFEGLEEVLEFIRSRPKPLALYLFSRDEAAIEEVLAGTSSGGVCINSLVLHFANGNLPFGGVGMSGMGNYHGRFGFLAFSHQRAVLRQGPLDLLKRFYPPYGPATKRLIDFAMRHLV